MGRRRPRAPGAVRRSSAPPPAPDAGLEVVSYGSYLGMAPPDGTDDAAVDAVLATASALGSPMVRIWTEFGVTPASSPMRNVARHRAHRPLVDRIAEHALLTALEFHPRPSPRPRLAAALLDPLGRPGLRTHWQPDPALRLLPRSTSSPW